MSIPSLSSRELSRRLSAVIDMGWEDLDIEQVWSDVQLTLGIVACTTTSEGIAALVDDGDSDVEFMVITWSDIAAEWSAWHLLDIEARSIHA